MNYRELYEGVVESSTGHKKRLIISATIQVVLFPFVFYLILIVLNHKNVNILNTGLILPYIAYAIKFICSNNGMMKYPQISFVSTLFFSFSLVFSSLSYPFNNINTNILLISFVVSFFMSFVMLLIAYFNMLGYYKKINK